MKLKDLAKEFPKEAVHWRAQTLTRNGDKALALAYIDARDVMDRLDDVCGPENWQSRYTETAKGRVLCEIGIKIGDEWVWKSDGAGDTAVEGEKGGISDALKRAAVQWGIGRYLYRLDAVWVPCETYERNGKKSWSKWTADPWQFVRSKPKQPTYTDVTDGGVDWHEQANRICARIKSAKNKAALGAMWADENSVLSGMRDDAPELYQEVRDAFAARGADLTPKEAAE